MRKKNTSGRVKLKTKYTNIKKNKQRKIKIKRDMKKNPNKYHKKKSDPGVPNSCFFKLEMLKSRSEHMKEQEEEREKRRQNVLNARQAMRDGQVGEKKKLTDVIDLKKAEKKKLSGFAEDDSEEEEEDGEDANDISDGEDGFTDPRDAPIEFQEEEMVDPRMGVDDAPLMEETPEEKENRLAAAMIAKKANREFRSFKRRLMYKCKNNPEQDDPDFRWRDWSDKVYYRLVKEVVQSSNVILEVLDARDPLGTRCPILEKMIRAQPTKRLILVLNKADLIPKTNLQSWLKFLRSEAPTVAFKAAVHKPKKVKSRVDRWDYIGRETMRTPGAMGANVLMQLLKNYTRGYTNTGIVVGVVGLPNVGKSSLINSLKKTKACDVAPNSGSTKNIQEIKLDKKLHLLDCPGVVMPNRDMEPVEAVLKNLVNIDGITNAVECAHEIIRRSDSLKLAMSYNTRKTEDPNEFLVNLAKKFNQIKKTGIYNTEKAAKKLIYDWNHGILKYYTETPKSKDSELKSSVKSSLEPAFVLDTLTADEEEKFFNNMEDKIKVSETVKLQPGKPIENIEEIDAVQEDDICVENEESDADDSMDEDSD